MTDDRARADEDLRQALIAHAIAYDIAHPDDQLLSDFVVVSHWQPIVDSDKSHYTIQYSTRSIPAHIVFGLLHIGQDLVGDHSPDDET